jgi:protein involved in polysaccharide export with SLBB domain
VLRRLLLSLPLLLLFSACVPTRYYNQRVMFRLTDEKGNRLDTAKLRVAVNRTDRNYRIQANDFLDVRVYTNKGERIIDPNGELQFGSPAGQVSSLSPRTSSASGRGAQVSRTGSSGSGSGLELLVQANGLVAMPVVGQVHLSGLSLHQADSTLQVLYSTYYVAPFVQTRVTNNRVIILGSPGGVVVPLSNDNMNLLEVLALAGGVDGNGGGASGLYRYGGKTSNVRIIRGNLKNPQVEQIDLSTIAGMRRANLQMEPNDIVYIEPVRRPFLEGLADTGPVISAIGTVLGTITATISIIILARSTRNQ